MNTDKIIAEKIAVKTELQQKIIATTAVDNSAFLASKTAYWSGTILAPINKTLSKNKEKIVLKLIFILCFFIAEIANGKRIIPPKTNLIAVIAAGFMLAAIWPLIGSKVAKQRAVIKTNGIALFII